MKSWFGFSRRDERPTKVSPTHLVVDLTPHTMDHSPFNQACPTSVPDTWQMITMRCVSTSISSDTCLFHSVIRHSLWRPTHTSRHTYAYENFPNRLATAENSMLQLTHTQAPPSGADRLNARKIVRSGRKDGHSCASAQQRETRRGGTPPTFKQNREPYR